MDWLEISLTVDGEMAEAVAEVLSRYAPNGVVTEQGVRYLDDRDLGTPNGPITVRAYLAADGQLAATRRRVEEALHYLSLIRPLPEPAFREVAEENWMESWRRHYRPIPIGRRLLVVPAWLDSAERDRVIIKIDPGMAFGTGTHPSTQLCLEMLEALLDARQTPAAATAFPLPASFIDIGCGSGILSIAAIRLGVRGALGVDIDPVSIQNARANAQMNGLGSELQLGVGSVSQILEGGFVFSSAALVAVNILAPVIVKLLDDGLANVLSADGRMILSGILAGQEDEVARASLRSGLRLRERRQMGEWVSICVSW
jgi:ribosomal protein L11 methyltransferase